MSIEASIYLNDASEVQSLESETSLRTQPLLLRVVLRTSRVRYDMHPLPVASSASGQTVMESLRELYNQNRDRRARCVRPLLRVLTMQDVAVSSATIVPVWFILRSESSSRLLTYGTD